MTPIHNPEDTAAGHQARAVDTGAWARSPPDVPLPSQRPVPAKVGAFVFPLKEVTLCSKDNRKPKSTH